MRILTPKCAEILQKTLLPVHTVQTLQNLAHLIGVTTKIVHVTCLPLPTIAPWFNRHGRIPQMANEAALVGAHVPKSLCSISPNLLPILADTHRIFFCTIVAMPAYYRRAISLLDSAAASLANRDPSAVDMIDKAIRFLAASKLYGAFMIEIACVSLYGVTFQLTIA